jgi:transcriptional regulator GlxA family with amidase domain
MPMSRVTGQHENDALTLFSRTKGLALRRQIIRMRPLRARGPITESSTATTTVATACGFTSISQFCQQFKAHYGLLPNAVRQQYVRMELRSGALPPAAPRGAASPGIFRNRR